MARKNGETKHEIRLRILDPTALYDYTLREVRAFVAGPEYRRLTLIVQRALVEEMTREMASLEEGDDPPEGEMVAFVEEARCAAWALLDDLEKLAQLAASEGAAAEPLHIVAGDPEVFDPARIDAARRALLLLGLYNRDDFGAEGMRQLYELLAFRHSQPWMPKRRPEVRAPEGMAS